MKKILIILLLVLIPLVSGQITQRLEFNEGDNFTLIQNCGLCSFVNVSSVINDNGKVILENVGMVNRDTTFIYDLEDNLPRGTYIVNTFGDSTRDNNITTSSYYLIIKPDDSNLFFFDTSSTFNIVVLILALIGSVALFFLKLPVYSGFIVIVAGFLLLFNDFSLPLSMIIVGMGVTVLFVNK